MKNKTYPKADPDLVSYIEKGYFPNKKDIAGLVIIIVIGLFLIFNGK